MGDKRKEIVGVLMLTNYQEKGISEQTISCQDLKKIYDTAEPFENAKIIGPLENAETNITGYGLVHEKLGEFQSSYAMRSVFRETSNLRLAPGTEKEFCTPFGNVKVFMANGKNTAKDTPLDPWESGVLESIGLGDLPKPKETYQTSCDIQEKRKPNPITGDWYTYQNWKLNFSDKLYQNYKDEVIAYLAEKCPCMIGIVISETKDGMKKDIGIVKSTKGRMGEFIHIHDGQVYFVDLCNWSINHGDRIFITTGEAPYGILHGIEKSYGPDLDRAVIEKVNQVKMS